MSSVEEVERKVASSVSHSPPLSLSRSLSDPFLSKKNEPRVSERSIDDDKNVGRGGGKNGGFFFLLSCCCC